MGTKHSPSILLLLWLNSVCYQRVVVDGAQAQSQPLTNASGLGLHPEAQPPDDLPVPVVRHYKLGGEGYERQSPLYKLQQEREAILLGPPVSVSMKCIINLMAQFFVVYTVLFVFQVLNRLHWIAREHEEHLLVRVAETVFLIPMLCVIFLTMRMHAVELTHGQTERYDLPPWWVKVSMIACTLCVMMHTTLVGALTLLIYATPNPATYGNVSQLYSGYVDLGASTNEARRSLEMKGSIDIALRIGRVVAMSGVYTAFMFIIAGIFSMSVPGAAGGTGIGSSGQAAIFFTVMLTIIYFAVHLASLLMETSSDGEDTPRDNRKPREAFGPDGIRAATTTVAMAPMLCVLFLTTRMRVLEVAASGADGPQDWFRWTFGICSVSLLLLVLLSASGTGGDGHAVGGTPRHAGEKRRLDLSTPRELLRLVAAIGLYGGLLAMAAGLAVMGNGAQGELAPPPPVTLECIMVLGALYFSVYLALWVVDRIDVARAPNRHGDCISDLRNFLGLGVKEAVSFCPMFCILFLGTLMRARQLAGGHPAAGPQPWCTGVERVATASIVVLAVARVDGILETYGQNPKRLLLATVCKMLQYVCISVLYISAIAVVVALFVMTPESALASAGVHVAGSAHKTIALLQVAAYQHPEPVLHQPLLEATPGPLEVIAM